MTQYKFITMTVLKFMLYACICSSTVIIADDAVISSSDGTNQYDLINESESKRQADDLLMNAIGMLGIPYKWAGNHPTNGMDCSGFIQYLFKAVRNIDLPRTVRAMSQQGIPVARNSLRCGDLIFFATMKTGLASHVGMYIGENKFIHTPRTGKSVRIAALSNSYWVKAYLQAKRIN